MIWSDMELRYIWEVSEQINKQSISRWLKRYEIGEAVKDLWWKINKSKIVKMKDWIDEYEDEWCDVMIDWMLGLKNSGGTGG